MEEKHDRSYEALYKMANRLSCKYFKVGILNSGRPGKMMLKSYTYDELLNSIGFLKAKNAGDPSPEQWLWILDEWARDVHDANIEVVDTPEAPEELSERGHKHYMPHHIYIKPDNEKVPDHGLVLVDDLSAYQVVRLGSHVRVLCMIVETSPDNYQVWLKFPGKLTCEERTDIAMFLAWNYHGDMGCAHGTHSGRAAGFTNCKPKYLGKGGRDRFPYVKLMDYEVLKRRLSDEERKKIERNGEVSVDGVMVQAMALSVAIADRIKLATDSTIERIRASHKARMAEARERKQVEADK